MGGGSNTPPAGHSVLEDFEPNLALYDIVLRASLFAEVLVLILRRQVLAVPLVLMPSLCRKLCRYVREVLLSHPRISLPELRDSECDEERQRGPYYDSSPAVPSPAVASPVVPSPAIELL
jgi:hypothetical protein